MDQRRGSIVRVDCGHSPLRPEERHAQGDYLKDGSDHDAASSGPVGLEDVLTRVGSGDRAAFEELYRRTSAKLFGICLRILPRRQEAEESLQEAYITIWQRAVRYDRDRGSAMSWLAVLTRNAAIDRLRNQKRSFAMQSDDTIEIADPAPIAFEMMSARQDIRQLHDCLNGLDPVEATFLRTAFIQGMTYADLADREKLPLGTVKSRIRRALLKMREKLS